MDSVKTDDGIKELLNKNIVIVEALEKRASMFSKSILVLSLLDVVFGLLAIFCTSLQLTALIMSASSLTAISVFGRIIQLSKIQQLNKSLKTLNLISLAWFVHKYKKYLSKKEKRIKMTKSTVLQKILTTILAVFGASGVVVFFLPQFTPIAAQVSNIVAMCSEALAVVSGIWLATTSDKVLSAEEIEADKKAKEAKAQAKELEKAKAIVAEYENAKAVVEKAEAVVEKTEENK